MNLPARVLINSFSQHSDSRVSASLGNRTQRHQITKSLHLKWVRFLNLSRKFQFDPTVRRLSFYGAFTTIDRIQRKNGPSAYRSDCKEFGLAESAIPTPWLILFSYKRSPKGSSFLCARISSTYGGKCWGCKLTPNPLRGCSRWKWSYWIRSGFWEKIGLQM